MGPTTIFMLLRFRFANFRSFRDEQEFSMIAGSGAELASVVIPVTNIETGVLPASVFYGANASGKSNVLRALQFMRTAVLRSHAAWGPDDEIPSEPFVSTTAEPATFVVDFVDRSIRYQYGFSLTKQSVVREWLHAYPKSKRQTWFERNGNKPMTLRIPMMSITHSDAMAITKWSLTTQAFSL